MSCTTLCLEALKGSVWKAHPKCFTLALFCIMQKQISISNVNFQYFILDIDECENGQNNCDGNARCKNTIGSFTCACKNGFYGDGVTCGGKQIYL